MANQSLQLMVRTRERVVFEGEVESVSSKNKRGLFDVLPMHGNFISLIDERLTVRRKAGGVEEVKVEDGVMRVVGNKIEVYLGVKLLS